MPPDFTPTPLDHDEHKHGKLNGFHTNPFSTTTAFTSAFSSARARNATAPAGASGPFRDTQLHTTYPHAADIFAQSQQPLQHHMPAQPPHQHFEPPHSHHSRAFDLRSAGMPNGRRESAYNTADPFGNGSLLSPHHGGKSGLMGPSQHLHQQSQHPHTVFPSGQLMPFSNNSMQMQSQTPFGPHLPANGPSAGGGAAALSVSGPSLSQINEGAQTTGPEEISTIFVVGFPDDMSEREFQNMFTFSLGFEAATLKIPNKESTAYGSGSNMSRAGGLSFQGSYGGTNDPYNLVTMNQGGVLVDGGRDGTTTSWPAAIPDDGHFVSNAPSQPPRKQIIGFAKFRTRKEALDARDLLSGRRVDIEKGAVLKAEMAKKNLHTKRGVGPLGVPLSAIGGGIVPSDTLAGFAAGLSVGGISTSVTAGEPLSARERELGAVGAMGLGGLRRESRAADIRDDDEKERERRMINAMGISNLGTRGPRERAEDDERERERRRKENEARLRSSNAIAFDAFHSVPATRLSSGTETVTGVMTNGFAGLQSQPAIPNLSGHDAFGANGGTSPWSNTAIRKQSVAISTARPPSAAHSSPPQDSGFMSGPNSASSRMSDNGPFSPPLNSLSQSIPIRARPVSPSIDSQDYHYSSGQSQGAGSSLPTSSASSVTGSNGRMDDLPNSIGELALSTSQGSTSPQLPSPASGASSGRSNPGDQNPPINTLYVGNLPTSPTAPTGYPPTYLEDNLRELFSKRPGYRKLCFRQKSNGPMCFVEFEDVHHAAKALGELYGNTLNGLVKGGGIRLSYSKNPLGVRTPTGTNGQQSQPNGLPTNAFSSPGSVFAEPFQPRQPAPSYLEMDVSRTVRRETSGVTSPTTSSYHYTMSPPPPRFFSPSPSSGFNVPPTTTAFPRTNAPGFGPTSTSGFSPFGMSPSPHHQIPDQSSIAESNEHLTRGISPAANPIEATRVV
ncbi:hypothetical protein JAAARDRAFT_43328 [Jaapia argillacea MUCL 33604]|uniref:RRM domain-containing protein n=1 Tax=Jaapia argillacea MUCL 33604 TaxID=933084 RepID=A0A067QD96_9AGAM|nr:hypothetical protein JAAARDRAFT_43328 [Jaapia argillacea MUCL 33604]